MNTRLASLAIAIGLSSAQLVQAQSGTTAQASASVQGSGCSYATCALAIVPRWNGLAVIRGTHGPRAANLNFFWPTSVTSVLRGGAVSDAAADSAAAYAQRALRLRRVGAALTDVGVVAAIVTVARVASTGRARREDKAIGGAGLAALSVSVPLQFAADGALSRAVWWHNVRFVR